MSEHESEPEKPTSDPVDAVNASASDGSTLQAILSELQAQNARLEQVARQQRLHGYRTSVLAGAASVLLGLTMVWGIAQTDWGARHFAVPVKFFVDSETAQHLGSDDAASGTYGEPLSDDEASDVGDYGADGYCESGTSYTDNFDPDCDVK